MRTGWFYHDIFLEHEAGNEHPERPERLRHLISGLEREGLLERMIALPFAPAKRETIEGLHSPAYVELVRLACERGMSWLGSPDTGICPRSYEVARHAVGAVLAACEAVVSGDVGAAFCAVRPPGHHAEASEAKGFCLFGNVALGAEHLVRRHGLRRVAVVDFDVHHGNGTQHFFEDRADVFFASIHEHPQYLFPGTGWPGEKGRGSGDGLTLNLPMPPGSGDEDYLRAFETKLIPALDAYRPEFLLLSTGFDAASGESLAHMELSPRSFGVITRTLVDVAHRWGGGRIVSVLEGGYEAENLEACGVAHVRALLEG
jgi:acetoin utilization deacetylase AcuC-like enzyme